jgi:hypothetical protein
MEAAKSHPRSTRAPGLVSGSPTVSQTGNVARFSVIEREAGSQKLIQSHHQMSRPKTCRPNPKP